MPLERNAHVLRICFVEEPIHEEVDALTDNNGNNIIVTSENTCIDVLEVVVDVPRDTILLFLQSFRRRCEILVPTCQAELIV